MKRFYFFSFLSALIALAASAEFSVGSLNYNLLSNGEVECTGFTSAALAQNPTTVTIPGRVKTQGVEYKVYNIAANAFKNRTSLKSVYVDWGIVEIGHDAFNGCTALYSVRLPSTITTIETYAFANCTSMGVFGIAATTRPFTASSAFQNMKKCNVHVATEAARPAYNSSTIWTSIDTDGSVARTPNLACDFSVANRYYIIHTGRTVSSSSAKATLIGVADNVTYIPITSVTNNAPATYGSCSSGYTAQVTRIAPYACRNNTKLTSVGRSDLGAYTGFEEVGDGAFEGCTAITFVGIPCGTIGSNAFENCTALTSVQLYSTSDMDGGVDILGGKAFYGCTQLKELLVSNTRHVLHIGTDAFGNNHSTFKCYMPIKLFYSNYTTVSNWPSTGAIAATKVHPFIVPKTEWTAISCFKPITLNYDNDAHYYTVTSINQGVATTATMQRVSKNYVEAGTGLLMQATPGVIYRFTTRTSGSSVGTNLLKAVNGEQEYLNNEIGAYRYIFNPTTKVFDALSSSNNVVYSGETYLETATYYTSDGHIYPDGTSTVYNLTINGKPVTSANCGDLTVIDGVSGTVNYNPETRTLALNGATVTGRINTMQNGIVINALGDNTVGSLRLYVQYTRDDENYTITGTGRLNVEKIFSCGNVYITGGVKLNVAGNGSNDYAFGPTLYEVSYPYYIYPKITISGQGTELRVSNKNYGLVNARSITLEDGHYIARPHGAYFKPLGTNDTYGYFIDAYGNEVRNTETELFITDADPRGFKYNGLWYEQTGTNTVQLIEPQLGENYTGDVVVPSAISRGAPVYAVTKIDTCVFIGTSVTSVALPETVTSIADRAFYGAKNLKTLVILYDKAPNKYTLLGENFVGSNASGFTCYVKNNTLLTWMQTYNSINFLPWVVTNSDNGFLTFSCARNVTLPNGLTAYRVSGFDQARRMATTTKLTNSRIPSKNGVILKGEPGTCYLLSAATSPTAVGDNMLRSLLVTGDIPYAPLATNPDDSKAYFLGNSCQQWNEFQNNIDLFMKLNTGIAYLAVDKTLLGDDYTSPVQLDLWSTTTTVTGDVDGDGKVDVTDVNAVINIILKTKQASDYPGNADVDGDSKVDVTDVNAIINIILKV
ncbi:MAG: leucine-rich repeat protein [Muribaculaceae bacterium]|nr:leucine-rich repeat protein [Muribaculaceae bacterium]